MGLNLATSDGRLYKTYRIVDGELNASAYYGSTFYCKEAYSNEEVTLPLFYSILKRDKAENICILPNVGENPFQRTSNHQKLKQGNNPLLADQERDWIQLDIDWGWEGKFSSSHLLHDTPHQCELKQLARYVLDRLGLPPSIGYVAQRSSSAKVKMELRIRLYILLDEALSSERLKEAFSAYDIDESMFEPNRIHLIHEPTFMPSVKQYACAGDDVILVEGERLQVKSLKAPIKKSKNRRGTGVKAQSLFSLQEVKNAADLVVNNILTKQFKAKELIPWSKTKEIYEAIGEHALANPNFWADGVRRPVFFWMLKHNLKTEGNDDLAREVIRNNPVMFTTDWSEERLSNITTHEKDYWRNIWNAGEIRDLFTNNEITEVHSNDMSTLSDKELAGYDQGGIFVLKAACGQGKSKLARRLFSRSRPRSSLSVSYSIATQEQNASELGQTFYKDAGNNVLPELAKEDAYFQNLSEAQKKALFMPQEEHLATTAQSLRYAARVYEWVFIDEIEHCLEVLWHDPMHASDINWYSMRSNNLWALLEICVRAKNIIIADDKASEELTGWFIQMIQEHSTHRKHLLWNTADFLQGMNVYLLDSEKHVLQTIEKLVSEGKNIAIQTSFANGRDGERPTMNKWKRAICKVTGLEKDREVVSFIAADFDPEEEARLRKLNKPSMRRTPEKYIQELRKKGARVVLCSTWNQVGWQFLDPDFAFDATVNIYTNTFTHAHDVKQGFRRWRMTNEHFVYITRRREGFGQYDIEQAYSEKRANLG